MDRYVPESTALIAVACNIKEAFDSMLTEASASEDEELFDYLDGMQESFLNVVKGDLLLSLIQENERKHDELSEDH